MLEIVQEICGRLVNIKKLNERMNFNFISIELKLLILRAFALSRGFIVLLDVFGVFSIREV